MCVTRMLWEIPFHHVPVRVVLLMHHQMHLCRQCIFYWDLGIVVGVPGLLPPLS